MNMRARALDLVKLGVIGLALKAVSLYKISFIFGSQAAFFNGSSVAIPLIGFFVGSLGSVAFLLARLSSWYLFSSGSLHLLSFVIPGFCASLYWTTKHSLLRFWLPLSCMAAFIAHPAGRDAFIYSFYWLSPVALSFTNRQNIWADALGSTFVAHAVGSVIWIYTVPTTAALWLSLLPVVAVERLVCAAGMAGVCYAYLMARTPVHALIARLKTAVQQYKHV